MIMFSSHSGSFAALAAALLLGVMVSGAAADDAADRQAAEIIQATGVSGGFIVHLGCGDGTLTAALRASDRYTVHGLDAAATNVQAARAHIRAQGTYGSVSVDRLTGRELPYVDNMVNLLVSEDPGDMPRDEMLRVLAPRGVAYVKQDGAWTKTVKPVPENIDEWTHYMHDASGNAVAHDEQVGPPRHLQWIGSPRWARHHDRMASMSALVSGGGRMFYIMDEGSRVSIQLPPKWTLIARDAFNGTVLWKQPLEDWQNHLWPLKSGPTQLARRLVTDGEAVYVTLGFEAPLTAIDAATGRTLRTYEQTASTEEVITTDGVLLLVVNRGPLELRDYAPQLNVGDQARVRNEFLWNEKPRELMAIEAESGRTLWKKTGRIAPLTLASARGRVYFHDGEQVVCLDRQSGSEVWKSPKAPRRALVPFNFGPKLVLYEDVVLFAGGDRTMRAFDAENGHELWNAPHAPSGYQSPEDVLVAGGLVWSGATTSPRDSGVYTGRDPRTGEVKSEFGPDVETYWFHHRCYMGKATDRFLLPSRTGIEFVDYQQKSWDINHWVRGGCLYGIMPCNGLVYAPPHDCACYPEVKLFGLNALAPASASRRGMTERQEQGRLQRGRAARPGGRPAAPADWPTYRHDATRSGYTRAAVPAELEPTWQTSLGGKLSAPTIADGKLLVAEVDAHTVHALDARSGEKLWSYTAGGRVDSPPTLHEGTALFGSADGWVYCLNATNGELIWRFRAAPQDRRLMSLEQLESVWPVHGNILVQDEVAYFVAGRSNFLDGGLRLIRLDARTGEKLSETVIDHIDPETGQNIQDRLQILQMPVGLPDVLSCDGKSVYMRSQQFDLQGNRLDLGPHSGQPAEQGSVQSGSGAHVFSPTGYLDGSWFHRSYWVYGRSFAGGHAGYYQAGKYAPSGRILVFDDKNVYGFGRKPQYLRWTTTLEYTLFAADKEAPVVDEQLIRRGRTASMVSIAKSDSLNVRGKAVTVEAWVRADRPQGVILARGGPTQGFALDVRNGGRPGFTFRSATDKVATARAEGDIRGKWVHLAGVADDKAITLYVDGKQAATAKSPGLMTADPLQAMEIGADDGGAVGNYRSPSAFAGAIDEVRLYHAALTAEQVQARFADPQAELAGAAPVLACSFDDGKAADASGNGNHGQLTRVRATKGKHGRALQFPGVAARGGGSHVKHHWDQDLPLFVRAMTLTGKTLFVAGPPDVMDEEETFQKLTEGDPDVHAQLQAQDAALNGAEGSLLWAISAADGQRLAEYRLQSLPEWDAMAAARGKLYLSTTDGKVICFSGKQP